MSIGILPILLFTPEKAHLIYYYAADWYDRRLWHISEITQILKRDVSRCLNDSSQREEPVAMSNLLQITYWTIGGFEGQKPIRQALEDAKACGYDGLGAGVWCG